MTNTQTTNNLQVPERRFKKARRNGPCLFIEQRIHDMLQNKKESNDKDVPNASTISGKDNYLENNGFNQSEWVPMSDDDDSLGDMIWANSDDLEIENLECEQEDDLFLEKEGKYKSLGLLIS